MKNLRQFLVLVIIVLYGSANFAAEIADSNLQVTYIGSTGYLLETANKKVLLDPTYGDIVQGFGYPYASIEIESKLLSAEEPFDNIDVILISHMHLGHFDAIKTYTCLKVNPGAKLITLQSIADSIASVADDFAAIESRIVVPVVDAYTTIDTIINELPVNVTKIDNHRGPSELLQFSFKMDSLNIAYYLDYNKQVGQEHHVKTQNIDLAILDGALMLENSKREMFQNDFEVGYSIFTHFTNATAMDAKLEENKDKLPNTGYMPASMDVLNFDFSNSSVQMTSLNTAPKFSKKLANDTIALGASFSIELSDLISDADGDVVTLTAKLTNGSELPSWINIDGTNMKLTGTGTEAQTVILQLILTDDSGAWTKTTKKLVVLAPTKTVKVEFDNDKILLYPSMARDYLTINISNINAPVTEITVVDVSGKVVMQKELFETISLLNVNRLPAGVYSILLAGESVIYTDRFVKK